MYAKTEESGKNLANVVDCVTQSPHDDHTFYFLANRATVELLYKIEILPLCYIRHNQAQIHALWTTVGVWVLTTSLCFGALLWN